ncbi:MAG: YedE family putative selenium transporter [Coriobacteriia bacterium]
MGKRRVLGPSAWMLGATGLLIGVVAAILVSQGNPGNMGLCLACFLRDIASFFAGEAANMAGTAYLRPEIVGLMLGATVASLGFREFRARGGSGALYRFALGFVFMVSALIFLGCPVRAWLRLGGGDLNAAVGVAGLITGVLIGTWFLKRGYVVGRSRKLATAVGWLMPAIAVVLLVLALVTSAAGSAPLGFTSAEAGSGVPGGVRAPLFLSLGAGLAIGFAAQRSRFCTVGGVRDAILVKRYDLLVGVAGLVLGVFVMNVALGQFSLGFEGQPAAHTNFLGNYLPMVLVGLTAVLMGGCPLRQVVMASEGDLDATSSVAGMLVGAVVAHAASIASTPAGPASAAWLALGIMAVVTLGIGFLRTQKAAA